MTNEDFEDLDIIGDVLKTKNQQVQMQYIWTYCLWVVK